MLITKIESHVNDISFIGERIIRHVVTGPDTPLLDRKLVLVLEPVLELMSYELRV